MPKLDALREECLLCRKCGLASERTNLVFGVGNEDSPVVFVGEAPGEQEDLKGEPVVGRAGKLLDDMLAMIDLSRSDIYIANIIKCRPPKNRDPLPDEQNACFCWLDRQLELIAPRLIVCLGRYAAMNLIKQDFKISVEHGRWFEVGGREVMAVYHPAALLRDPRRRPEAFEDFKELKRKLDPLRQSR
ncbi:MAG: uracil-DNA glycosylase [Oscillospiraceae bacterium]|nr:uracil-DNA glycosylase [Oscillospiraceae bacterium]